jgi:DNA-binding transcriptional regulator YiaG
MSEGGRYFPLFERLKRGGETEITLSFAEIEALIAGALPPSARKAKAWWSNRDTGVQAAAWMQANYRVAALDLANERVTFRRHRVEYHLQRLGDEIVWDGEAIRALRVHMGMSQSKFADVLGVRQQTVSEWEKGTYTPTRSTGKHLTRVAKEARFTYDTTNDESSA